MSLDEAQRAFAAGDFAQARRLARQLETAGPEEAKAAAQILSATGVDPLMIWVSLGCLLLFLVVAFVGLR